MQETNVQKNMMQVNIMPQINKNAAKPKRSVPLTQDEIDHINKLIAEKGILEVSFSLRVARDTLTRVLQFGSGAEKTILKIRENLPK